MSKTSFTKNYLRTFILFALILVCPNSFAFAADIPDQKAIDAFLKYQDDKTDSDLNAQISELTQNGYKKRGSTGAVLLGGGCGVVGCNSTYLVTTVYSTPSANPRSTIVAAIVTNTPGYGVRVKRILSRGEIESLVNPK